MKKLFIIGNWKSYKTIDETTAWFVAFSKKSQELSLENKEAILCVPFTLLPLAKSLLTQYNLPLKLGAQNISPFDERKYTGEAHENQLPHLAPYALIRHSQHHHH